MPPLWWCSRPCWCRRGWRPSWASLWWNLWAAPTGRWRSPRSGWSRSCPCRMHWTGSERRWLHLWRSKSSEWLIQSPALTDCQVYMQRGGEIYKLWYRTVEFLTWWTVCETMNLKFNLYLSGRVVLCWNVSPFIQKTSSAWRAAGKLSLISRLLEKRWNILSQPWSLCERMKVFQVHQVIGS